MNSTLQSIPQWVRSLIPFGFFLLVLAICFMAWGVISDEDAPSPPPAKPVLLQQHQIYRLQWLGQAAEKEVDPILVPSEASTRIELEFVDMSPDPIPEDALLVLYLHKDRDLVEREAKSLEDATERGAWKSTPGPGPNWFGSLFGHSSWGDEQIEMEDGPAIQVATTKGPVRLEGDKPVYRFEIEFSGNELPDSRCKDIHNLYSHEFEEGDPLASLCREDFGVAFAGESDWILAEVEKEGGRPRNAESELGYANATLYFKVVDTPPWWFKWLNDPNLLAFIFVCLLWLVMLPLGRSRLMRGYAFIIGMIILAAMVNYIAYRFVFDPTAVDEGSFDLAKQQAVLRMSEAWDDDTYLQPHGCQQLKPATSFPDNLRLTQMRHTLDVAIVPCPGSNWSGSQPGVVLTWQDMFGIQTMFIFGAPWRLYQEEYLSLGRPTGLPYLVKRAPDRIAQNFGIGRRIVYQLSENGQQGDAWIQNRNSIFWKIPNIFCIENLTATTEGECWSPIEPPAEKATPFEQQPETNIENWISARPTPLGGRYAPLNFWRALLMAISICLGFLLVMAFVQVVWTVSSKWGCLGQFSAFIFLGAVGATVMIICLIFAFSDPRLTLEKIAIPDQGSFKLPDGPIGILTNRAVLWTANLAQLPTLLTSGNLALAPTIGISFVFSGLAGLLAMPIWIGMALGGVTGGYIGAIIEVGFVIGGIVFAALPGQEGNG